MSPPSRSTSTTIALPAAAPGEHVGDCLHSINEVGIGDRIDDAAYCADRLVPATGREQVIPVDALNCLYRRRSALLFSRTVVEGEID